MLDGLGYEYVILNETDTRYGAVETLADAKKCAELFSVNRNKITGIIVCIPNFGDEAGVVNALKMSRLDVPALIQACDDEVDKMELENRRDSFCGKLSICNNLNQYNIKFTNTTLHTCAINSEEFVKDVQYFARLMNYLCKNGFEHHIAMNRSNSSKVLEEALGNYLGWDIYKHS